MNISTSEKRYDTFVVSLLIVFFSVLWFVGSVNLVKEMKKNNQLTGFAISDDAKNQTQPQEIYSIKSYTIFYLSIIFLLIIVVAVSLTLIVPRLKKYT
ncbi:hypothetical protein J4429_04750 [Candidatus Pacearchaeota archaeon]|nr:hypothetical protein [Candidatus Pacearchaeota archaeon]